MVLLKIKYFKLLVFEYFFACSGSSIHIFFLCFLNRSFGLPPYKKSLLP